MHAYAMRLSSAHAEETVVPVTDSTLPLLVFITLQLFSLSIIGITSITLIQSTVPLAGWTCQRLPPMRRCRTMYAEAGENIVLASNHQEAKHLHDYISESSLYRVQVAHFSMRTVTAEISQLHASLPMAACVVNISDRCVCNV